MKRDMLVVPRSNVFEENSDRGAFQSASVRKFTNVPNFSGDGDFSSAHREGKIAEAKASGEERHFVFADHKSQTTRTDVDDFALRTNRG